MLGRLDGKAALRPIHRAGELQDIAHAALWLASDESGFVNGRTLVMGGGLTCCRSFWETTASFGALATAMGMNVSGPK